jgi:hypothetical protein
MTQQQSIHRVMSLIARQVTEQLNLDKELLLGLSRMVAIAVPVVFGLVQVKYVNSQAPADNPALNLGGTWQGTLHTGQDLHKVFKIISNADGGGFRRRSGIRCYATGHNCESLVPGH